MPESTNSLLDEGSRVLRELAVQQGLAYRSYGEALQRFGEKQIGLPELFKATGDIYYKETARAMWGVVLASTNIYSWLLSAAGAKPTPAEAAPAHSQPPIAAKRTQRGRG